MSTPEWWQGTSGTWYLESGQKVLGLINPDGTVEMPYGIKMEAPYPMTVDEKKTWVEVMHRMGG